jgi:hypothetical protein
MGRIGEVVSRTWRTAAKMRELRGPLEGDSEGNDNIRVKRYVAKYTVNPFVNLLFSFQVTADVRVLLSLQGDHARHEPPHRSDCPWSTGRPRALET